MRSDLDEPRPSIWGLRFPRPIEFWVPLLTCAWGLLFPGLPVAAATARSSKQHFDYVRDAAVWLTPPTRFTNYVHQGGTLLLNTAYLREFPQYAQLAANGSRSHQTDGKGRVIVYGPDFQVDQLPALLREQLARDLPVEVSPGVEYAVNVQPDGFWVTLINNEGVTKEPRKPAVIDATQSRTVSVCYQGRARVRSVTDIKNRRAYGLQQGREVSVNLPAGELAILEFRLK